MNILRNRKKKKIPVNNLLKRKTLLKMCTLFFQINFSAFCFQALILEEHFLENFFFYFSSKYLYTVSKSVFSLLSDKLNRLRFVSFCLWSICSMSSHHFCICDTVSNFSTTFKKWMCQNKENYSSINLILTCGS